MPGRCETDGAALHRQVSTRGQEEGGFALQTQEEAMRERTARGRLRRPHSGYWAERGCWLDAYCDVVT